MSWQLVGQIALLMILIAILVIMVYGSIIDKRREDNYKRKANGL